MTTTLHILTDERQVAMHSGTVPKLHVRHLEDDGPPPPCDVLIVVSRQLPPHLLRSIFDEALARLSTVEVPNMRSPYQRSAA